MNDRKNILLLLSSGGMMLSCFYACTAFVLACLSHYPISLTIAAGILVLATIITHIHNQRGWRRIYVFGLHVGGFLLATLWLCYKYYGIETQFWHLAWIKEFIILDRGIAGWLGLILILLGIGILWFFGKRLGTQPTVRTTISHRYDLGLACFLILLLIKLIIAVKGAIVPFGHSSIKAMMTYITFGLFSMGLVHTQSDPQTTGASYFKGIGIVMSFTTIALMLGGGMVILFLSDLQIVAERGSYLLKTLAKPMEQFLITLSHLFLTSGIRRKAGKEPTGDLLPTINRSGGELGILHYLFIGISAAILLMIVAYIIYNLLKWIPALIKWLFTETKQEKDKPSLWRLLLSCILATKRIITNLWARIFHPSDTSVTAEKFYRHLLRWGRLSGIDHVASETPQEYGIRLWHRFPRIEKEFRLIIKLHNEALYGCISPNSHQISRARHALKKIHAPSLWFARIKSLCFQNRF
jgi:hypothetical protein